MQLHTNRGLYITGYIPLVNDLHTYGPTCPPVALTKIEARNPIVTGKNVRERA